jgi:hypothetical protein
MFPDNRVWKWTLAGVVLLSSCATLSPTQTVVEVRPPAREEITLLEKAMKLEDLIQKRHLTSDGLLAYGIGFDSPTTEEVTGMAFSDMAVWSGCYVAAQAFRYAVTGDSAAEQQIRRSIEGLHLLQAVTGKPGLLARGIKRWDEKGPEVGPEWHRGSGTFSNYQWLGDVSADQVDGVIFGYGVAFDLVGDPALKQSIAIYVRAIADHLRDHGMTIQDVDGQRTKHGDLTAGLFTEPLNALIALAVVKAAYHMSMDEKYQQQYLDLVHRQDYHKRAVKARDPWWEVFTGVNHSDNNLAFLAYYTLLRYEKDAALLDYYLRSLNRAWRVVRSEGNPLFTFIYHALVPMQQRDDQALANAVGTMRLFPVGRRDFRVINSAKPDSCISFRRDRFGRKQACQPVPMNHRPADVFEWKENPYRLDGGGEGSLEFSGVDYLLPYWMGRYHGFILEDSNVNR